MMRRLNKETCCEPYAVEDNDHAILETYEKYHMNDHIEWDR